MATRKKTSAKKTTSSKSTSSKSAGKKSSAKARAKVGKVMHEFKHGELKSGGRKQVKNPKQAIAIGLSEARRAGANVPPAKRKSAAKGGAKKSGTAKKSGGTKKPGAKKTAKKR